MYFLRLTYLLLLASLLLSSCKDGTSGDASSTGGSPSSSEYDCNINLNGTVNAIAKLSNGNFILGGDFTSYGATTANRILMIDSTCGVYSTFQTNAGTGFDSTVRTIVVDSDYIYIGGDFTTFNGNAVPQGIIKLTTSGEVDTTFKTNAGNGFNAAVRSISTDSSYLYIGGSFTTYNGVDTSDYIMKISISGLSDSTFQTNAGAGLSGKVHAVHNDGEYLYIGGNFNTYAGVGVASNIIKISVDGVKNSTFQTNIGTGFNDIVRALAETSGGIYAGGDFTTCDGNTATKVARVSSAGIFYSSFQTNLGSGFNGDVYALDIDENDLYVGGEFTQISGNDTGDYIARLTTSGYVSSTFQNYVGTGFNDFVRSIYAESSFIYTGGDFTSYDGTAVSNKFTKMSTNGEIHAYWK